VVLAVVSAVFMSGHVSPAVAAKRWLKPHCQSGSATLGKRAGIVKFKVSCRRGKGRFFRFVVARGDGRGRHVSISGFSVRPRMGGPGAVAAHGFCRRLRQEIACRGRGRGRVTLRGWIRVPPINLCRSQVRLVQVVPSVCNPSRDGYCDGVLKIDWLYEDLPQGC
jgi:hypothetical protein